MHELYAVATIGWYISLVRQISFFFQLFFHKQIFDFLALKCKHIMFFTFVKVGHLFLGEKVTKKSCGPYPEIQLAMEK